MHPEVRKYLLRFMHVFVTVLPIMFVAQVRSHFDVILYKLMMASIAIAFAEFVWAFGFKPHIKGITNVEERKAVWMFRGILYAAIIASMCLGL